MTGNVQKCPQSHGAADRFLRLAGDTAVIHWHDLAYDHGLCARAGPILVAALPRMV
jgi:hypothetical protein